MTASEAQLRDTRRAFDSVAAEYDGPLGNNELVQRMRTTLWRTVEALLPSGSRLLDLGCGAGIDVAHFVARGYTVVAIDWSPAMVERTRARIAEMGAAAHARVETLGIQELDRLQDRPFDGIYSDFGPLNCVPDLAPVAAACAERLAPGGYLIATVMGRLCPWEFLYYAWRGRWGRACVRGRRGLVPVSLNQGTVWTRYYTPREFYQAFARQFALTSYRGLNLFLPPPYLVGVCQRAPHLCAALGWLDDRLAGWPLLREAGDHFLIVLTRRALQAPR